VVTVTVPLLSMGMSEGKIVEWFAENGSVVAEGQPLYAMEFEKSVMDIESPAAGTLTHKADVGTTLPVGAEVAEITP